MGAGTGVVGMAAVLLGASSVLLTGECSNGLCNYLSLSHTLCLYAYISLSPYLSMYVTPYADLDYTLENLKLNVAENLGSFLKVCTQLERS